jgi:hypothetical protein
LPLTSSVATLRGSGREAASPSLRIARPALYRRLVKDGGFAGPGRLPSPSAPSPGREPALSRGTRGISRSPPPVSLLACWWLFATAIRLPTRFHPLSYHPWNGWSQGARPMAFRLDRAPLVDFCNQHSPRAHPQTARTPPRMKRACARARRSPASPSRSRRLPRRARPKRSAPDSHDNSNLHLEDGWRRRAGSHPRCPLRGRDPCGLQEPFVG